MPPCVFLFRAQLAKMSKQNNSESDNSFSKQMWWVLIQSDAEPLPKRFLDLSEVLTPHVFLLITQIHPRNLGNTSRSPCCTTSYFYKPTVAFQLSVFKLLAKHSRFGH